MARDVSKQTVDVAVISSIQRATWAGDLRHDTRARMHSSRMTSIYSAIRYIEVTSEFSGCRTIIAAFPGCSISSRRNIRSNSRSFIRQVTISRVMGRLLPKLSCICRQLASQEATFQSGRRRPTDRRRRAINRSSGERVAVRTEGLTASDFRRVTAFSL